ncbi:EamA family transporter [Candidatus Gracilibacteria bacterium]|nr:EamA family transporter [Candidatus Gracilibacteria bacterium]
MNIGYLYFLLPVIFLSATGIIHVAIGRKIGAKKLSLYRQITLMIIGSPLLFGLLNKTDLIEKHILLLIASGIVGTGYLLLSFHAMNITSVGISKSFLAVSRTISSFCIGFFLLQEAINIYDIFGMLIIFLGFYILGKVNREKLTQNDIKGITVSLLAGVVFSINILIFKIYAADFTALESAYLLESMNAIFLVIFSIFYGKNKLQDKFKIPLKTFFVLCLVSPLVLVGIYGLAMSVNLIPFYIFNTGFIFILIVSTILGWIFLKEKFSLGRGISLGIMIIGSMMMIVL